jgi:hypothetical protein
MAVDDDPGHHHPLASICVMTAGGERKTLTRLSPMLDEALDYLALDLERWRVELEVGALEEHVSAAVTP